MLADTESDRYVDALRLRRTQAHYLVFLMREAQRLDPARWRLGHVLARDIPAHLVRLGDELLAPRAGDHVVGTVITHAAHRLSHALGHERITDIREVPVRLEEVAPFGEVRDELFPEDVHAVLERRDDVTRLRPAHGVFAEFRPLFRAKPLVDRL